MIISGIPVIVISAVSRYTYTEITFVCVCVYVCLCVFVCVCQYVWYTPSNVTESVNEP